MMSKRRKARLIDTLLAQFDDDGNLIQPPVSGVPNQRTPVPDPEPEAEP